MKLPVFSCAILAALTLMLGTPHCASSQQDTPQVEETILATVEAPLTRDALNVARRALLEQDIRLNYGNFVHDAQSGALIGAEVQMVIGGVEYHEYVEFNQPTCKLRIIRESGFRMEGC